MASMRFGRQYAHISGYVALCFTLSQSIIGENTCKGGILLPSPITNDKIRKSTSRRRHGVCHKTKHQKKVGLGTSPKSSSFMANRILFSSIRVQCYE